MYLGRGFFTQTQISFNSKFQSSNWGWGFTPFILLRFGLLFPTPFLNIFMTVFPSYVSQCDCFWPYICHAMPTFFPNWLFFHILPCLSGYCLIQHWTSVLFIMFSPIKVLCQLSTKTNISFILHILLQELHANLAKEKTQNFVSYKILFIWVI